MKNVLKVVFVLIGTLIGAGFASGQEIYVFFFSHGMQGILGILISCFLMGIVIYKTLKILKKNQINTYNDFLNTLLKKYKNTKIVQIINMVINIFILVTFFIMIAGFGAYFEQELGINSIIGSLILATFSFIVFTKNIKGVVKVNELIVPILIVFLSIIGIINLKEVNILELNKYVINLSESNWFIDAILYCSYNSILLIPVILTLKEYLENKRKIKLISIITTIITIILSFIVFIILVRVDVDIKNLEMPAVYVVSKGFEILRILYGFIILASIFTTSVSLGTSFLQNTSKNKKNYTQIALLMCITSVLVSKIGFSNLVSLLYPIFGYLGLVQIIKIIFVKTK